MSSCMYYLTADIPADRLDEVCDFWKQGREAHDWWQAHRDKRPADFWPAFVFQFPRIAEYLKTFDRHDYERVTDPATGKVSGRQVLTRGPEGDCNNSLAAVLCFDTEAAFPSEDSETTCRRGELRVKHCGEVWSFADWEPIAEHLRQAYDARRVAWLSEEQTDGYWDALDRLAESRPTPTRA